MQTTEQQLTDRFTKELKEKTDLLAKETAKATSLSALINNLKSQESSVKTEMAKVKAEGKAMSDKYNRLTLEHSQAFIVSLPNSMTVAMTDIIYRRPAIRLQRSRPSPSTSNAFARRAQICRPVSQSCRSSRRTISAYSRTSQTYLSRSVSSPLSSKTSRTAVSRSTRSLCLSPSSSVGSRRRRRP
jgi:hypothetical protein